MSGKITFIHNYPQTERGSTYLFNFFCSEVLAALSHSKEQELWIVSPWLRNIEFDLSNYGNLSHLFPNITGNSLSLLKILERLAELHVSISIVTKPPHMLFNIVTVDHYINTNKRKTKLTELFKEIKQNLEEIPITSDDYTIYKSRVNSKIDEIYTCVITAADYELERDKGAILPHNEMVEFIQNLSKIKSVNIYYNERLHGKMIVGANSALFGSANLTNNGFNNNDELIAYITDIDDIASLRQYAEYFAATNPDLKELKKGWTINASKYSARYVLEKNQDLTPKAKEAIITTPLPDELYQFLSNAGLPVIKDLQEDKEAPLEISDAIEILEDSEEPEYPSQDTVAEMRCDLETARNLPITDIELTDWEEMLAYNPTCQSAIYTYICSRTIVSDYHKTELQNAYTSALEKGYRPHIKNEIVSK